MNSRRGMSLVEVLLGLSIGAMLLMAVATAVHGSSRAMTNNEQFFKATQSARLSLLNISMAVRTSGSARFETQPTAADLPVGGGPITWPADAPSPELVLLDEAGTESTYKLVPASPPDAFGNLVLERGGKQLVLARNVADIGFTGKYYGHLYCDLCDVLMRPNTTLTRYECPRFPDSPTHVATAPRLDLVNVQIQMTVQQGQNAVNMSSSAVPRKILAGGAQSKL